jgi:hypothetical protein
MSSSVDSESAPGLSASRLILLPNDDLEEYTTDDDDDNEDNVPQPATHQLPVPPLSPSVVFLYLLSPYLRLGAIYAADIGDIPFTYGLAGLVVAASLSAFCRQIWFLLGRYLRKSSTEDIHIHIFARRHRRLRKHGFARYTFSVVSGLFRLLLAAMYLRGRFALCDHDLSFLMLLVHRLRVLCAPPQSPRINSFSLSPQYFDPIICSGICTLSLQVPGLQVPGVHDRSLCSFVFGVVGRSVSFLWRERTFASKPVPTGSIVE